jgi:hypothetical protein
MTTKPRKITKAQYNVLCAIQNYSPHGAFSARDLAVNARTLTSLFERGILRESNLCYVGSDETLYEVNLDAARAAFQSYR